MHPNPAFRTEPAVKNIAFAREQGFGVLAVVVDGAPLVSHIPFLLSAEGDSAEFHLVRSNPIARALKSPLKARLAVQGPHSYVSPDWYEVIDQVPTWNYVAVHLSGEIELQDREAMRDLLDRQSAAYETRLLPKMPWTASKMTPEVLERMMRQIVLARCRSKPSKAHGNWVRTSLTTYVTGPPQHMEGFGFGTKPAFCPP